MYILQESLFSFEILQKLESKERLPIFFSALDLRPYTNELKCGSPRGADGHCRQGILRALLAAPLENINTFSGLHHRLDVDLRFRYQCGLRLDRPAPSISTLSRVFAWLTKKGLAKQLFEDLVTTCKRVLLKEAMLLSIVPPSLLTKKSNQRVEASKQATPTGGQNSIPLGTKSNGLATSSTLPWIPKVNFRWL